MNRVRPVRLPALHVLSLIAFWCVGGCHTSSASSPHAAGGAEAVPASGSAGTTASGGVAGAPVGSGRVGSAGGAGSAACWVLQSWSEDCGTCIQTLDEYCTEPDTCYLMEEPACFGVWTVDEGCGLIRISWEGDVSDRGMRIYNADSRELVYMWDNGQRSAGCYPDTRVGEEPSCDTWTSACSNSSAGGAGGAGG
jgi:hypothetical protein